MFFFFFFCYFTYNRRFIGMYFRFRIEPEYFSPIAQSSASNGTCVNGPVPPSRPDRATQSSIASQLNCCSDKQHTHADRHRKIPCSAVRHVNFPVTDCQVACAQAARVRRAQGSASAASPLGCLRKKKISVDQYWAQVMTVTTCWAKATRLKRASTLAREPSDHL